MEKCYDCSTCLNPPNKYNCTVHQNTTLKLIFCNFNATKNFEPLEEFRELPNFVGEYEISSLGRFRDVKNNKIIIPLPSLEGYTKIYVQSGENDAVPIITHKAVQAAFMEDKKSIVDHINRKRFDNKLINLRTCSNFENMMNKDTRDMFSGYYGVHYDVVNKSWYASLATGTSTKRTVKCKSAHSAAVYRDLSVLIKYGFNRETLEFKKLNLPHESIFKYLDEFLRVSRDNKKLRKRCEHKCNNYYRDLLEREFGVFLSEIEEYDEPVEYSV